MRHLRFTDELFSVLLLLLLLLLQSCFAMSSVPLFIYYSNGERENLSLVKRKVQETEKVWRKVFSLFSLEPENWISESDEEEVTANYFLSTSFAHNFHVLTVPFYRSFDVIFTRRTSVSINESLFDEGRERRAEGVEHKYQSQVSDVDDIIKSIGSERTERWCCSIGTAIDTDRRLL